MPSFLGEKGASLVFSYRVYTWYEDFVHHIAIERSHFSAFCQSLIYMMEKEQMVLLPTLGLPTKKPFWCQKNAFMPFQNNWPFKELMLYIGEEDSVDREHATLYMQMTEKTYQDDLLRSLKDSISPKDEEPRHYIGFYLDLPNGEINFMEAIDGQVYYE